MELYELVERIQRWKERQAVERGEVLEPAGEAPAEAQYYGEGAHVEAPVADAAAIEDYVESVDEVGEALPGEVEADAVEEVEPVDEVEPEPDEAGDELVEAEGGWDEEEDSTSEVDLDQIEELEEVE